MSYEKLQKLEPQSLEPQVWLAIAREQDGDVKGAEAEYRRLLPGAEDPWKGLLEARLKSATEKLGGKVPAEQNVGPAGAPAAAAPMSPADRDKMINQMVDGLAARLKENGKDLDGWMRLVRSYVVLGRREEATTALASARGAFAGDDKSLAELNVLAETLGLGS
jgi:cytochrome c-type biogenesis protein CcmH